MIHSKKVPNTKIKKPNGVDSVGLAYITNYTIVVVELKYSEK